MAIPLTKHTIKPKEKMQASKKTTIFCPRPPKVHRFSLRVLSPAAARSAVTSDLSGKNTQ